MHSCTRSGSRFLRTGAGAERRRARCTARGDCRRIPRTRRALRDRSAHGENRCAECRHAGSDRVRHKTHDSLRCAAANTSRPGLLCGPARFDEGKSGRRIGSTWSFRYAAHRHTQRCADDDGRGKRQYGNEFGHRSYRSAEHRRRNRIARTQEHLAVQESLHAAGRPGAGGSKNVRPRKNDGPRNGFGHAALRYVRHA